MFLNAASWAAGSEEKAAYVKGYYPVPNRKLFPFKSPVRRWQLAVSSWGSRSDRKSAALLLVHVNSLLQGFSSSSSSEYGWVVEYRALVWYF